MAAALLRSFVRRRSTHVLLQTRCARMRRWGGSRGPISGAIIRWKSDLCGEAGVCMLIVKSNEPYNNALKHTHTQTDTHNKHSRAQAQARARAHTHTHKSPFACTHTSPFACALTILQKSQKSPVMVQKFQKFRSRLVSTVTKQYRGKALASLVSVRSWGDGKMWCK